MKDPVVVQTAAGPVRFCTVWEFLEDVQREYTHEYRKELRMLILQFQDNQYGRYTSEPPMGCAVAESVHKLVHNPIKLITELKKTTTKKYTKRNITLPDFVDQYTHESLANHGTPTHLFCVGEGTLCLVDKEDVILVLSEQNRQQLICRRPDLNFTIKAPNLLLEGF